LIGWRCIYSPHAFLLREENVLPDAATYSAMARASEGETLNPMYSSFFSLLLLLDALLIYLFKPIIPLLTEPAMLYKV
jgi:hypothetical protein